MEKISIVTVVFNRKDEFEETIKNITSQSYKNLEIIIIDGGSTDGTVDVIKKYDKEISYWVSEPDKNIYHAMNKGISIASGRWINFMNAGDLYYDNDVLTDVFQEKYNEIDLLIGNSIIKYDEFSRKYQNGKNTEIWKGARFIHQSCFIKTDYQKKNLYNETNTISADFEFFFKAIEINKINTQNLDKLVSIFRAGGLSDNRRVEALISNFRLVRKVFRFSFNVIFFYSYIIFKELFKSLVKIILPKNLVKSIQKYIHEDK